MFLLTVFTLLWFLYIKGGQVGIQSRKENRNKRIQSSAIQRYKIKMVLGGEKFDGTSFVISDKTSSNYMFYLSNITLRAYGI